jgi:hypothetical protein
LPIRSLATVGAIVAMLLLVSRALASPAPTIRVAEVSGIKATRAHVFISTVGATEEHIEIATSESGPWTSVNEGHRENANIFRLKPETTYYVLFFAANSAGSATKIIPFTTHGPEAPEIGRFEESNVTTVGPTFLAVSPTQGANGEPGGLMANDADTEYSFSYSESPTGPWTPATEGATGTLTTEQDSANPEARFTGLQPDTTYFVRLGAKNGVGQTEKVLQVRTRPASPVADGFLQGGIDVGADAAAVSAGFRTRGSEAHYRIEFAPAEAGGGAPPPGSPAWAVVPGGSGVFPTLAPSEFFTTPEFSSATATIPGLSPASVYYVRDFVENGHPPSSTSEPARFETAGPPGVITFATHAIDREQMRALGSVDLHTAPVDELQGVSVEGEPTGGTFTLTFEGQTTAALPFDARPEEVGSALEALPAIGEGHNAGNTNVTGARGGPYAVRFVGKLGAADQPQLTADGSALTPSGSVVVSTLLAGHTYDTQAAVEYVDQKHFEEGGFASPATKRTAEVDLGAGNLDSKSEGFVSSTVGADLPGTQPGVTYHYRLFATNTTPGGPVVHGPEQTLTVPIPGEVEPGGGASQPAPCPNEALRSGASAGLPDCRSYEQVTPVDKEGTQDLSSYGGGETETALVGEDGEHFFLHAPGVQWGSSPDAKVGEYYFTRGVAGAWKMTSPRPVGETGPTSFPAALFTPDLTQVALEPSWATSVGAAGESPDLEFDVGAPGGPYTTAASVPRNAEKEESFQKGWVAASRDFSKLVLATGDRTLVGRATGTLQGQDLYEYTAAGLSQLNVSGGSPGTTIGTCGAKIVNGKEAVTEAGHPGVAPHAVATDGGVFFEAIPSSDCSEASHLYMRKGGVETTDIGPYTFLAGNAAGTQLLLEPSSDAHQLLLYDVQARTATPLLTFHQQFSGDTDRLIVSEDFTAFYFGSSEQLTPEAPGGGNDGTGLDVYRYDLSTRALSFAYQDKTFAGEPSVSPDGRYLYTAYSSQLGRRSGIAGLPTKDQVYRYDSATHTVECLSCASSYDPEPAQVGTFLESKKSPGAGQVVPALTVASANGDYVFFDTPAALLPADIDGEVRPEHADSEHGSGAYSVSSDVYEWRRNGLDGCSRVQGCLALISGGRGGYKTELLGTTPSGRDVLFATHEALGPADRDTAGDVYDARIGGGQVPPAPRPVECEADACSTPPPAPSDPTPASSTFQGAGNLVTPFSPPLPQASAVKKKCAKGRRLARGKCVKVKVRRRHGHKATHKASAHRKKGARK